MNQTIKNPSDTAAKPADVTPNRRSFLKGSTAAAAGVSLAALPVELYAQVAGSDKIRVGIVGTGGRGSGAIVQDMKANDGAVLVAAGDVFEERLNGSFAKRKSGGLPVIISNIEKSAKKEQIDLPKERQFVGFDAYQNVIDSCDLVVLTTPPGFRPMMFEAAINAGKHVFMEKPVCTDAKGYNRVIKAAKMADEKGLKVVVGLQRHYQDVYRQAFDKVHGEEKLIGDIVSAQCWWNGSRPWTVDRDADWSELTYQMHNWYHFDWICGDHIAEQHVHNIDVINWFVSGDSANGGHPVVAQGMGGRTGWEPKTTGNIFDHHYVEFRYDNGVIMNSQCRHIRGCKNKVAEEIHGTKGILYLSDGRITDRKGNELWKYRAPREGGLDPYQVEHNELHAAIKNNTPLNNAYYGAHSSFTSAFGRLATYSGQEIKWDDAVASNFELVPDGMTWDSPAPVQPVNDKLEYDSAMPGTWKLPWA